MNKYIDSCFYFNFAEAVNVNSNFKPIVLIMSIYCTAPP